MYFILFVYLVWNSVLSVVYFILSYFMLFCVKSVKSELVWKWVASSHCSGSVNSLYFILFYFIFCYLVWNSVVSVVIL